MVQRVRVTPSTVGVLIGSKLTCIAYILLSLLCVTDSALGAPPVEGNGDQIPARVKGTADQRLKVGLALSGGGARGLAHIGVLKVLERSGIKVDMIAGSSIGAIIGGLYASGYRADALEEISYDIDWQNIFANQPRRSDLFLRQKPEHGGRLLKLQLNGLRPVLPVALINGQRLESLFMSLTVRADHLSGGDFDKLPIPFRAVAVDLLSGDEVVLNHGNLSEAMRASMAIPGIFTPIEQDERLLVDGGMVNYLPVDIARQMGADIVIAVNVKSRLVHRDKLTAPWKIFDQALSVAMDKEIERNATRADVLIRLDNPDYGSADFVRVRELVAWGERDAKVFIEDESEESMTLVDAIPRIKNLLAGPGSMPECGQKKAEIETARDCGVEGTGARGGVVLRAVYIQGNTVFDENDLMRQTGLLLDCPANDSTLAEGGRRIVDFYLDKEYALARCIKTYLDQKSGVATIVLDEGVVDSVVVEGNSLTKDRVILREFPQKPGTVFSMRDVDRGIRNVYSSGLFERVAMKVHEKGGKRVLLVRVQEKGFNALELGARYGQEMGGEGFIKLVDENLLGTGYRVALRLQKGKRRNQYGIRLSTDRFFKTSATYNLDAYWRQERIYAYDGQTQVGEFETSRYGGTIAIGQHIYRSGAVSVEARAERVELNTISGQPVDEGTDIRTVILKSRMDTLDRFTFPTSGSLHHVWLALNGKAFGSDRTFIMGHTSLESYYTVEGNHTFRPRIAFGFSEGDVPLSEKFSLGGQESFFGYRDHQLRGGYLFLGSLTYRLKLGGRLFLRGRYDVGNTWQMRKELKWDLKHGIGGGIGLDTPIGPLQVDYGRAIAGTGIVYFHLGQRF